MEELSPHTVRVDFDALFALSNNTSGYFALLESAVVSLQAQRVRLELQVQPPPCQLDFFHRIVSVLSYLLDAKSVTTLKRKVRHADEANWTNRKEEFSGIIENVLNQVNSKKQALRAASTP